MFDDVKESIEQLPESVEPPPPPPIDQVVQRARPHLIRRAVISVGLGCILLAGLGYVANDTFRSAQKEDAPVISTPEGSWRDHHNSTLKVTLSTREDWAVSWGYDQRYVYVHSRQAPLESLCTGAGNATHLGSSDAWYWMFEDTGQFQEPFPERPTRFDLEDGQLGNYEGIGCMSTRRFLFEDSGRNFVIYLALGPDTSSRLRDDILRSLDSIRVEDD